MELSIMDLLGRSGPASGKGVSLEAVDGEGNVVVSSAFARAVALGGEEKNSANSNDVPKRSDTLENIQGNMLVASLQLTDYEPQEALQTNEEAQALLAKILEADGAALDAAEVAQQELLGDATQIQIVPNIQAIVSESDEEIDDEVVDALVVNNQELAADVGEDDNPDQGEEMLAYVDALLSAEQDNESIALTETEWQQVGALDGNHNSADSNINADVDSDRLAANTLLSSDGESLLTTGRSAAPVDEALAGQQQKQHNVGPQQQTAQPQMTQNVMANNNVPFALEPSLQAELGTQEAIRTGGANGSEIAAKPLLPNTTREVFGGSAQQVFNDAVDRYVGQANGVAANRDVNAQQEATGRPLDTAGKLLSPNQLAELKQDQIGQTKLEPLPWLQQQAAQAGADASSQTASNLSQTSSQGSSNSLQSIPVFSEQFDPALSQQQDNARNHTLHLNRTAPTHHPLPSEQVVVKIAQHVHTGKDSIEIQLDPAELGRVEVRMEVAQDGRTHMQITAENKDTLDMLQRDARALERALQQAGMDANARDMEFNLSQNSHDGEELARNSQEGNGNANAYDQHAELEDDEAHYIDPFTGNYTINVTEGLDIKV